MNLLLSCLLLCFSFMANASTDLSMDVHVNQKSFVVTLPSNPTTGYQWSVVAFDKDLLTLSGSNFERSHTNLIGAGGQMHFTFTLNKDKNYPVSTQIVLKYARSWELGSGTVKNVVVHFVTNSGDEKSGQ